MAEVNLLLENTASEIQLNGNGANGKGIANGANGNGHALAPIDEIAEQINEQVSNAQAPPPTPHGQAGPLGDWTEVMVSRRYFRSGESEYLLNKVPCRLRDIVEFFLGTGAGTKAYSIIEQGRVDHLINAKADEIRILIEEAAGVSLYRSRRLAAERKLERTHDNLSRVADLLHEMERQLGSLRRQAKKADQYQTLQEELKTVDLTLQSKAYQNLLDELASLEQRRSELLAEEERLSQEAQQLQTQRSQAMADLEEQEAALRATEEECHTLESALQQGHQRKQFFLQQDQRAADRATATQAELAGLDERQAVVQAEIEQLSVHVKQSQEQLGEEEAQLQSHEQHNAELQQRLLQHEAATEECKTEIVDLLTQEAQVQNALAYARRRASEVEHRLQVLSGEAERVSGVLAETERTLTITQNRAAEIRQRVVLGQRQRVEKADGLREVVSLGEQLEQELAAAWAKQAELRTRLSTLEEMEQGFERYAPGVQSIMALNERAGQAEQAEQAEYAEYAEQAELADTSQAATPPAPAQILGVVAQLVEVPHAYERAVAAVLREKLEYIVVPQVEDGLGAVEYLRTAQAGHGSFIPRQPKMSSMHTGGHTVGHGSSVVVAESCVEEEQVTALLSVVSIEPAYRDVIEMLLDDTFVVPDLQTALQLWHVNSPSGASRTFVTPEGEVLSAEGVVSGGSEGFAEESLLERRREIRDLHQHVAQQDAIVEDLVQRRQHTKQTQQELEGELARLEAQARALGEESETLQREAGKLEGEQRRLLDKKEGVAFERQTLEEEEQSLSDELQTLAERESGIVTQRQAAEAQLADKQDAVAQAKVGVEQQRARSDELRIRVAERRQRQEGMRVQQQRLQEQQRELLERAATCQSERDAAQAEGEKIRTALAELEDDLVQQGHELATATQHQTSERELCSQLRSSSHEYEERIEHGRNAQAKLQEEKTRLEVSVAQKRVNCEHLESSVDERYGIALTAVLPEYVTRELEVEAGEARRQELRDRLSRMGEVNPGAATELAEVEERYDFLKSQESDLHTSIEDLQNTIAKLNRESRDRFTDTFALVDAKFREVYERLVEGGKAQINLTDENDVTHSGVEISVQPPGKRLRSLQLLSGGEKALAALSFTFALFLIRPSPFCVPGRSRCPA